jgi:hypothetical protein
VVVPAGVEYLFYKFWELVGGERITYSEIVAYQQATGCNFEPWEVEAIKAMDGEYQTFVAEKTREAADA